MLRRPDTFCIQLCILQYYNACCVNDISKSARMSSCDTSIEKWCCSLNSCTTVLSIVNFQRQRLYFLSKFRGHYNRPRQHYFVVASLSNINLCAMVKENPMRYQCKSVLVCMLKFNSLSQDMCVLPNYRYKIFIRELQFLKLVSAFYGRFYFPEKD